MSSQPTRRPCCFCGATDRKITKEHVWPKWLRDFIEGADRPEPMGHSRTLTTREGQTLHHKSWQAIPIDAQVNDVCHRCNEGWMEQHLETAVRPYLIPMLKDEKVTLDGIAQVVLAQWATLRVLVAQFMHPPGAQVIPKMSYRRFYEARMPPPGAQVWVGRRNGEGAWPTDYLHGALHVSVEGGPNPELPNGLAVGYVAFLYSGHEIENGPVYRMPGLWPYFRPILPAGAILNWPLPGLIGGTGLEAALNMFPIT